MRGLASSCLCLLLWALNLWASGPVDVFTFVVRSTLYDVCPWSRNGQEQPGIRKETASDISRTLYLVLTEDILQTSAQACLHPRFPMLIFSLLAVFTEAQNRVTTKAAYLLVFACTDSRRKKALSAGSIRWELTCAPVEHCELLCTCFVQMIFGMVFGCCLLDSLHFQCLFTAC